LAKASSETDNVDAQLADGLPAELLLGLPRATIEEACAAPALILLAPDLKEELPVLYLRLRAAAIDRGLPIVEIAPRATGLSKYSRGRAWATALARSLRSPHALVHGSSNDVGPHIGDHARGSTRAARAAGRGHRRRAPVARRAADGVADAIAILTLGST